MLCNISNWQDLKDELKLYYKIAGFLPTPAILLKRLLVRELC
jgi:hypothetical protein